MRRRILAVLIALALALMGSLAVVAYVRGADERALADREAVAVLVATKRIPAGTSVALVRSGGLAKRVVMPAATVPDDALSELDVKLDTLVVTADVQPAQLLLRGMFGESTRLSGGLAVPDGKMAISVQLSAANRVAGFVRPGSRVAIFDTFTIRAGKGRVPAGNKLSWGETLNHATRVVLPRVEVIAVGERSVAGAVTEAVPEPSASAEAKSKGSTSMLVTVAVTQEEAERLVHVAQTGTLYLALLDDTAKIEPGAGVDDYSVFP